MGALHDFEFSNPAVAATNRWLSAVWNLFFGNDLVLATALAADAVDLDPSCAMAHGVGALGALLTGSSQATWLRRLVRRRAWPEMQVSNNSA